MKTERLSGREAKDIARAGELIARGELVAIPTETVYGLGCDALNPDAVSKIFAVKGRPQDNPLIVHIADLGGWDKLCADIPDRAYALARAFWPGPLTIVLKKKDAVPDVVSAGLDTVGVRMPAHPVALAVIRAAGRPVAAPSANLSGRPSPTRFAHVEEDLTGKVAALLDGGDCAVGMESTVVDLTGEVPLILRPGAITRDMIEEVLGAARLDARTLRPLNGGEKPSSPGMKYRHYAPRAEMILFTGAPQDTAEAIKKEAGPEDGVLCFSEYLASFSTARVLDYGGRTDAAAHAGQLFARLREFDHLPVRRILAQCPRPGERENAAINRLLRAAAFRTVPATPIPIVGVTGRSGSGKSALAAFLQDRGARVCDADRIYAGLLGSHQGMRGALAARFGDILTEEGIDRRKLGGIVFNDKQALLDLNAITHPHVKAEIRLRLEQWTREGAPMAVIDVPLLFESDIDLLCTLTVGVVSDEESLRERIRLRDGLSAEAAALRLRNQPDRRYYEERCDVLIENDGSVEGFHQKLSKFFERYLMGKPVEG